MYVAIGVRAKLPYMNTTSCSTVEILPLSSPLANALSASRVMMDAKFPGKNEWLVVVETSMEGCEGPHEEENEAVLKFTDDDSYTSTRSSISDTEDDVEDPIVTTDFEE